MKKIKVVLLVNEVDYTDSFADAVSGELGWLKNSGTFVEELKEVGWILRRCVLEPIYALDNLKRGYYLNYVMRVELSTFWKIFLEKRMVSRLNMNSGKEKRRNL